MLFSRIKFLVLFLGPVANHSKYLTRDSERLYPNYIESVILWVYL